jgi:hypothetical protein
MNSERMIQMSLAADQLEAAVLQRLNELNIISDEEESKAEIDFNGLTIPFTVILNRKEVEVNRYDGKGKKLCEGDSV